MKIEGTYSIWLMPAGKVYEQLQTLIHRLSEQYNTPRFEPHVTLIGGLLGTEENILSKTVRCASVINPFTINLTHISYLDEYFRCLFIKVAETEKIMRAHATARNIFCHSDNQDYLPHLSLMYGDFRPNMKKNIITRLGKRFDVLFNVNNITLFLTAGKPKNWQRIKTFSLK